jgi:hypothetical protein
VFGIDGGVKFATKKKKSFLENKEESYLFGKTISSIIEDS